MEGVIHFGRVGRRRRVLWAGCQLGWIGIASDLRAAILQAMNCLGLLVIQGMDNFGTAKCD
jgi:hypothetical protein